MQGPKKLGNIYLASTPRKVSPSEREAGWSLLAPSEASNTGSSSMAGRTTSCHRKRVRLDKKIVIPSIKKAYTHSCNMQRRMFQEGTP
jgi:hypothetical protein